MLSKYARSSSLSALAYSGNFNDLTNKPFSITNGNIGIGTANAGSFKLAVEGTIGARKLTITQAPWADYVFNADYKLRSLQEVEKFIKQYKHLPEVPTTREITEQGLDVAETQALLLKKIEELTLYMIEQEKRIKELEKMVKQKRHN